MNLAECVLRGSFRWFLHQFRLLLRGGCPHLLCFGFNFLKLTFGRLQLQCAEINWGYGRRLLTLSWFGVGVCGHFLSRDTRLRHFCLFQPTFRLRSLWCLHVGWKRAATHWFVKRSLPSYSLSWEVFYPLVWIQSCWGVCPHERWGFFLCLLSLWGILSFFGFLSRIQVDVDCRLFLFLCLGRPTFVKACVGWNGPHLLYRWLSLVFQGRLLAIEADLRLWFESACYAVGMLWVPVMKLWLCYRLWVPVLKSGLGKMLAIIHVSHGIELFLINEETRGGHFSHSISLLYQKFSPV